MTEYEECQCNECNDTGTVIELVFSDSHSFPVMFERRPCPRCSGREGKIPEL